jgi:N-acetylglutamate synthase-like GNAT family acetyltransferase
MLTRPAETRDNPRLAALLAAERLPSDDVADAIGGFVVAERDGMLVGGAGLERHGRFGLLRSVAVTVAARNSGVAARLVADRLAATRTAGDEVYLLTETAQGYVARPGFLVAERASAPQPIRETREFATLCPASATLTRRPLTGD